MQFTLLPLAFLDIGGPEFVLILFAVLVLFGGTQLPELARGLGRSIREFKKASAGVEQEIKRAIEAAPEPERPRPAPASPLRDPDPAPFERETATEENPPGVPKT